ncbi:MAG: leucine-rich repeat domain-containing protein [Candidatus Peribacteria bacterium]|nr:leucine-rich repeat domain-containing protein [Candidatus Peribacteria bacterium]
MNLQNLQLPSNQLTNLLPGAFDNLSSLTDLELGNTQLTSLPK